MEDRRSVDREEGMKRECECERAGTGERERERETEAMTGGITEEWLEFPEWQ